MGLLGLIWDFRPLKSSVRIRQLLQVLTMFEDNIVLFATLVLGAATLGIFVLWGPGSFLPRRKRGQVVGLVNLGHTCFLNTLLQALASCPQYIDWLQHNNKGGNLTTSLHHVLQIVNGSDKDAEDPFTPSLLIRALSKHGWVISSGQQDAHELFQVMMETLEEEMLEGSTEECSLSDVLENCPEGVDAHSKKRRLKTEDHPEVVEVLSKATGPQTEDCPRVLEIHSDTTGLRTSSLFHTRVFCSTSNPEMRRRLASSSVPPSPFQGLLTSQLICTQCGYKSAVHYDKFDSLPLSLPAGMMTLKPTSLVYLLESFVATELVRGVKCEGCKEPLSSVLKSLNFGKLPQCLCFHISRTAWQDSGHAYKRHDLIEFPQLLCMEPYLYPHCRGEQSLFPLKKPREEPVSSTSLRLKHWYQLVAVVVHIGDAHSGHFATYRRVTSKLRSSWWYTSDRNVRKCSVMEVMQSSAYMLFYTRTSLTSQSILAANCCCVY
uniref:ubiquitinyl hydrolase 1 n=1 Tax=Timema bartmani TaxID=61472 RepID=A0A7R9I5M5_9NEOP|nr:unnamed protein product [Timema bartmani]